MDMTAARIAEEIVWEPSLFSYDKKKIEGALSPAEIDITGRPRILVHGPYVPMPAGLWRARVRFCVDGPASSHRYRMDWGRTDEWGSIDFCPRSAGIYELDLDYGWEEPAPCEVRLILMEGSFDGALTFMGATIALLADSDVIDTARQSA